MIGNQNLIIKDINYGKFFIFLVTLFSIIYGIYLSRFHFLDDTFIHLKIAKNLLEKGFYSFNGIEKDFSTSSPLYTYILSISLKIWDSPYLPKLINILIYILTYLLILIKFFRSKNNINNFASGISLLVFSSPLGIRWLTDGMESCLVLLFSILLANNLFQLSTLSNNEFKIKFWFNYFFLTATSIFLRIEFAFIILWTIFSLETSDIILNGITFTRKKLINNLYQLSPIFFSFSLIFFTFGHLTPDTSIAKSGFEYNIFTLSWAIIRSHLSASFFGIFIFAIWIISFLIIYLQNMGKRDFFNHQENIFSILVNFSLPFMLILVALKGQIIQGIRYFIFIESFLITFNYLYFYNNFDNPNLLHFNKIKKSFLIFIFTITTLWFINDFHALARISKGRSETFFNLKKQDFTCFRESKTIAWDVGMIGYFSNSYILDVNGLVNGRDIAKLSNELRIKSFIKNNKIDYIFANESQYNSLNQFIDLYDWLEIGRFDFPNFRVDSSDTHYLLKSPDLQKC